MKILSMFVLLFVRFRCGWCEQGDYVETSGKTRCDMVENLKASGCLPKNINPKNAQSEATVKEKPAGTSRKHQIYPQEINIKLRPKSPVRFKVGLSIATSMMMMILIMMTMMIIMMTMMISMRLKFHLLLKKHSHFSEIPSIAVLALISREELQISAFSFITPVTKREIRFRPLFLPSRCNSIKKRITPLIFITSWTFPPR